MESSGPITVQAQIEWKAERLSWCPVHEVPMEPVSRGIFKESPKRIVYEVMFHCTESGCTKMDLQEWRIKDTSVEFWDMMFFGACIEPEPAEGESSEEFAKRLESLYIAFHEIINGGT